MQIYYILIENRALKTFLDVKNKKTTPKGGGFYKKMKA